MDEAAALPSPRVLLSRRLKRYYGRPRLPPGSTSLSRLITGYRKRRSDRAPSRERSGRGGSPRFPLPPSQRSEPHTPGGSSGLRFQALHPFHGLRRDNRGSAPPVPARRRRPNDAAGFASRYGPLSCSPQRGFRRWASTRPVSRPSRQPATGPPGSYPDGTRTRRRQRAYVGSGHVNQPPPTSWRTLSWTKLSSRPARGARTCWLLLSNGCGR